MQHAMTVLINHHQLSTLVEKSGDKTEVTKLSPSTTSLKLAIHGLSDSLICINNCLGDNVLIGSVNDIRLIRDLG